MWVGVIVVTGESPEGRSLSPMVFTTGAKDDQSQALQAGNAKAQALCRYVAIVSNGHDSAELLSAGARVGHAGIASWTESDGTEKWIQVSVSELSDSVRP